LRGSCLGSFFFFFALFGLAALILKPVRDAFEGPAKWMSARGAKQ
jgi:hypothetical protein